MIMSYLINLLVNSLVISHERTYHNLDYIISVLLPTD